MEEEEDDESAEESVPRLISRNRTFALLNAAAFGTAYDAVRHAAEGLRRYSEDESEIFYDQGGNWVQCSSGKKPPA